jgi:hypothetical protein
VCGWVGGCVCVCVCVRVCARARTAVTVGGCGCGEGDYLVSSSCILLHKTLVLLFSTTTSTATTTTTTTISALCVVVHAFPHEESLDRSCRCGAVKKKRRGDQKVVVTRQSLTVSDTVRCWRYRGCEWADQHQARALAQWRRVTGRCKRPCVVNVQAIRVKSTVASGTSASLVAAQLSAPSRVQCETHECDWRGWTRTRALAGLPDKGYWSVQANLCSDCIRDSRKGHGNVRLSGCGAGVCAKQGAVRSTRRGWTRTGGLLLPCLPAPVTDESLNDNNVP